ncbi:MAG: hypothetical protein ACFFER_05190 [Candidatus Thorarchaeota archaeon]
MSEKDVRKHSSMDCGQYEPTDGVADVLASKFLSYIAFSIIIALITFIALIISQPIFIIEQLP